MRYVAQGFVKLIEKYPYLQTSAFIVVTVLGLKLSLSVVEHLWPESGMAKVLTDHNADMLFSAMTLILFFSPIVVAKFEKGPGPKKG